MPDHPPRESSIDALVAAMRRELQQGLARAQEAVYRQRVLVNWRNGRHIHRFLAAQSPGPETPHLVLIAEKFDCNLDVVRKILKFYRSFPKLPKDPPLSWSQYRALLTAPAGQRSLLLQRAITEDIGADALYALISVSRHKNQTDPAAATGPAPKLDFKRGRLFTYKTLQGKHLKLKKGEIMVDGGFKWRHKVKVGAGSKLTGGHIVRSVKTEDGGYELKHCNDDVSSLYTYVAEVERVVDADTFLLTIDTGFDNWLDSRVRLRGIDAPEISTAAGRRAYNYVKKALGNRPVVIKTYKEEKYGRYLVDLFYMRKKVSDPQIIAREGIFLNQELLDLGLAKLYKDPSSAPLVRSGAASLFAADRAESSSPVKADDPPNNEFGSSSV
ncbi:MAG: thermonuclease family protein [Candidatus Omnitrophica bacterium]|nr:thermonuclease family protein [Candidatus Omnitrophota bacterium]